MSLFNHSVYDEFVRMNAQSINDIRCTLNGVREVSRECLVNIYKYMRHNILSVSSKTSSIELSSNCEKKMLSVLNEHMTMDYMDGSIQLVDFVCLLYVLMSFSIVNSAYDTSSLLLHQIIIFHNKHDPSIIRPIPIDSVVKLQFDCNVPVYIRDYLGLLQRDCTSILVKHYYEYNHSTKIVSVKPQRVSDVIDFKNKYEFLRKFN